MPSSARKSRPRKSRPRRVLSKRSPKKSRASAASRKVRTRSTKQSLKKQSLKKRRSYRGDDIYVSEVLPTLPNLSAYTSKLRDILNSLAYRSNVDVTKSVSEPVKLTPTSSDTIRLVGLDLEFFKDVKGKTLNFPSQIGLCYYDVDLKLGTIKAARQDGVLENLFIMQPDEDLIKVDWEHAEKYIDINNPDEFRKRASITFSQANTKVVNICKEQDFYFVGHSIVYDIIGMKIFVDKERIIDTAEVYKQEYGNKKPSLATLARDKLNKEIQRGIHPPLVDAYIPIEILCRNIGELVLLRDSPQANVQTWWYAYITNRKGRIIGKGGQNIEHVRSNCGDCEIKIEEDTIKVCGPDAEIAKAMLNELAGTSLMWFT